MTEPLRYEFPPPERKHLLGSFTAGQIAITLITLLVAVFGIARPNPTAPRMLLAGGMVAIVVVPVATPWRGRILTEWIPIVLRYLLARRAGRTDYRSTVRQQRTAPAGQLALPAEIGPVEFLAHPYDGGVLGVAVDRRAGLYTGILEVDSPSFLLEDLARQQELLARWGGVLARLSNTGTEVHRLQWLVRTVPDDGNGIRNYLRRAQAGDLDQASAVIRSYLELVRMSGPASSEHTTLVAIQISSRDSVRAIRAAGGGDQGACTVLADALAAFAQGLDALDVSVRRPLGVREYQGLVRTAFDPDALADLNVLANLHPGREWGSDAPWPYATEERWGHYRTADRAWHRAFDLVLPMTEVVADWFVPLLLEGDVSRTISMTLKGVPRQQANREVNKSRTSLRAEQERKAQVGQLQTATDDKRGGAADRRMHELADGHGVMVYAVTVIVTAPDVATLDRACRSVEHVAGQSYCELRLLEGQQAPAFTWALPLGRGLD
jgi:Putative type VII ESX secretion system translocon, EccE